jgi:hypothetical protein
MIDLSKEKLISLEDVATLVPGCKDHRIHRETLRRWHRRGRRGVRLEALVVGNRICTSIEAVQRFLEAVSTRPSSSLPRSLPPAMRSCAEVKRATRKAMETLKAAGA